MQLATVDLISALQSNPDDPALLAELQGRMASDPEGVNQAVRGLRDDLGAPLVSGGFSGGTWSNCIGNQTVTPARIEAPTSLADVVALVQKAAGAQVRVVGSGHSYSDVAVTSSVLVDPRGLNGTLAIDASVLTDPSAASTLFAVESGISIAALNAALAAQSLALVNMGAYNGQTIIGAISTGTHGTGVSLGPLASSVVSLVLVAENGVTYQIEPSAGITSAPAFAAKYPGITLVQDDDWFQSVVVSMGCMGIVYSLILRVVPAYLLEEDRVRSTWEEVKPQLLDCATGGLPAILTTNRHYEVDINPYVVPPLFGSAPATPHGCIVTTRNIPPSSVVKPSGSRGIDNFLAGLLASIGIAGDVVVWLMNAFPKLIPSSIQGGIDSLVDSDYVDWSYKVLDLGASNNVAAVAIELNFPIDLSAAVPTQACVSAVDALLALYVSFGAGATTPMYQTGPVGVRFVAAADAYLAQQYAPPGATRNPTCTVELDMLVGTDNAFTLLQQIQVAMYPYGARVHWGLELDTLTADNKTAGGSYPIRSMYPKYDVFQSVRKKLCPGGMFDNAFTKRVGFTS